MAHMARMVFSAMRATVIVPPAYCALPCISCLISFTGELSYEINVPASYGNKNPWHTWHAWCFSPQKPDPPPNSRVGGAKRNPPLRAISLAGTRLAVPGETWAARSPGSAQRYRGFHSRAARVPGAY